MFATMNGTENEVVDISESDLISEALEQSNEGDSVVIVLTGKLKKKKKDGTVQLELKDAELEEPGEDEEPDEQPGSDEAGGKSGVDYVIAKHTGA